MPADALPAFETRREDKRRGRQGETGGGALVNGCIFRSLESAERCCVVEQTNTSHHSQPHLNLVREGLKDIAGKVIAVLVKQRLFLHGLAVPVVPNAVRNACRQNKTQQLCTETNNKIKTK